MVPDRVATQSPAGTPPRSQTYSPAPRRGPYPSQPQFPPRPNATPRVSSLSLVSTPAASTTNLPTLGVPHVVPARTRMPPSDAADPLQVLQAIMGGPVREGKRSRDAQLPDLLADIDFGGLGLEDFAKQEASSPPLNVHSYTAQSIEEYNREKDKFEDLHRSISACDNILSSVETYLTNFQSDLGSVSSEIETLQSRSTTLNQRLENRRVVEKLLGPTVEEISLSPAIVRKIAEGPIDESWIKALQELDKRTKVIEAKLKDGSKLKAVEDLKPLLDDLNNKAVERIRDYLVSQIKALRSPNINAQIIQSQSFAGYQDLYAFLARHQQSLADGICQAYINTMRWYYLNHFTRYEAALRQLKLHSIDKTELLGTIDDPAARRGKGPQTVDPFSLGRRLEVLKNPSPSALSAYLAGENKGTHFLELPFRAFNLALIDNASYEYTFLSNFFAATHSFHAITRTFDAIFAPTVALGQAYTKSLVENTTDALGILLAVRINQALAFDLQRRKVPAVENYTNATNMLLWPRFQQVLDQHVDSLKRAAAAVPSRSAPAATASALLAAATGQGASVSGQSTAPHPLTQRLASFLAGLLELSAEAGDEEPVARSVGRLRAEFDLLLGRLSRNIGGVGAEQRKKRFLFNNYSLVGTILEETKGRLADEIKADYARLKQENGDALS
ncbi:Sac2 family protein [Trichodelitschia bisporula]|uniref:Sac2 family protein n=1 Tax=Trichodelitschia bisporula TaxID=703511 RepID=A0A6G1I0F7_9PEZI|nr:Sac2 family protein [Trichodelitschia bisporula]